VTRRRLDVVVIGGGPAGLAAADAAARVGGNVLLIDQGDRPGGQIWRHRPGDALPRVAQQLLHAVHPPRVSVAARATVIDANDPHALVVDFHGRVAVVESSAVVIATGATERFLPFPGWTIPGVVGVGAMQALVKSGLTVTDRRIVLAGAGPLSLAVAATLARAGADVRLIAEQASSASVRRFGWHALRSPTRLGAAIKLRAASLGTRYRSDSWPLRAIASSNGQLQEVVMSVRGREQVIACDWLATSAGLIPRTELARLLGCEVRDGAIVVDEEQATSVAAVFAAGECTGIGGDEAARIEGAIAGMVAAGASEVPAALLRARERSSAFAARLRSAFAPRPELADRVTAETIVCRCEDITRGEIDPSWGARRAKLWGRVGMGACQGAICGAACTTLFGWEQNTVRPPLEQPLLGAWARAISDPES
jgi:NADPH-dependent 2,4-dienoyl-CoA reductase/sulfur reductase-like enzyme